ncbi:LytTR family transcriptional regulator [Paenibacillus taihuensis]|uniref:LytTR family transcriptional regulator n=1 Tax=Paenibacillus taihuensis TaxID=1156355 RepID=A0A3D9S283_9BACL|nr:LytTR family transcriptional regulator DNA-binding domain-containing protein [Paenibacillus taihuensis]REE82752.1 LytTR family transcriptional regulator [Paenibacillus taihuensis]
MMKVVADDNRNVYENFEVEKDIYYFKVGKPGMVSFHGRNYNIKKNITTEQLNSYISSGRFIKVNGSCYVNKEKVLSFTDGFICFDHSASEAKQVHVSKWRLQGIKNQLSAQGKAAM